MKFYLQLDEKNIIRDVIEFPYSNYIEYETEYPLPIGVYGGWFKLEDGNIVEYPELKPLAPLEERVNETNEMLMLALAELDSKRESDKLETQLAIAELAQMLVGGE